MNKILPSERIKSEIAELLSGSKLKSSDDNILSDLVKKSAEKLIQEVLEQEVKDYLGRDYFARGEQARPGYRNGYEPKRLKTAEGLLELLVPQLRNTEETYRSQLLEDLPNRSEELRHLATEMYVRGLSTRDVEETFKDKQGEPFLSKSAVSELTASLNEAYEQFIVRDLSGFDVVYLFVDAVYESLREETKTKEALLCAWAILSNGEKVLLHLSLGNKESKDSWREFFRDMQKRGLRIPLLITSDGSPGLIGAIDECFALSKRQRCLFHKLGNIANKLPQEALAEVMPEIRACYYAANREVALQQAAQIIEQYAKCYPAAIKCFQEDLDACIAHLEFPKGHHKFIRTTNLLERCFGEQKRRTKVIPRFMSEACGIKLVFATLIRVSEKWRKIRMNKFDLVILKNLRSLYDNKIATNDGFISMKLAA